MAVLMGVLGGIAIFVMPKDIFPYINIPVISVVWSYSGLSPEEMADRVVTISERAMTTTVNDIEHMESTSYNGVSVIKVFFQPRAKVGWRRGPGDGAFADHSASLPPGITPPNIRSTTLRASPSSSSAFSSDTLGEERLYD